MKFFLISVSMFLIAPSLIAQDNQSKAQPSEGDEIINSWLNGDVGGCKIEDDDDDLTRLKKQRVNIVLAECKARLRSIREGRDPIIFLVDTYNAFETLS